MPTRRAEVLDINIEDLPLAGRRCPVREKGAQLKAAAVAPRKDYLLKAVSWDAGTARLLPRLLRGRTRGPVFVTHRRLGRGKVVQLARHLPGHRAWPPFLRAGPRTAGRAHCARAGHGLGPGRELVGLASPKEMILSSSKKYYPGIGLLAEEENA